jgi:DNA-binding response OmpR family regulator
VSGTGSGRILVVEDDATVAEVVTRYLEREGFEVEAVGDGRAAVACATADPPDLVVLDLMLPGLDGCAVCRRVRAMAPVPVIMLTGRGQEHDRVAGLELGADDYVVKPFSPRELTARVKSVLRRAQGTLVALGGGAGGVAARLRSGALEVDVPARQAFLDANLVAFTAREFELLVFLMRHPLVVFRREELLERVWGWTCGDTATVTVHVRRIREKIEAEPARPRLIGTVWGVGYRFEQPVEELART